MGTEHKLHPPKQTLNEEMQWEGVGPTQCGSDIGKGWKQIVDACEHNPNLYIDVESLGNIIYKVAKEFDIDLGTDLIIKIGNSEEIKVGGESNITVGGNRNITAADVIVNGRSLEALFARVDDLSGHHNKGPF